MVTGEEARRRIQRVITSLAVVWVIALCRAVAAAEPEPLDVLVVAPHSDDEAIGCTATLLRALARKERVAIVVVTAGDGFPKAVAACVKKPIEQLAPEDFLALAALRQRHTLEAMTKLGVHAAEILFLGYPDGGLKPMYEATGTTGATPYRQPYTKRDTTYGIVVADYRTQAHGTAAPYLKASVITDLSEIIRRRRPRVIYTTHEVDTHADHRATSWFVRDAARAAGYQGTVLRYVVHGQAPPQPPEVRVALTEEELRRKRATLEIYQAGVSPVHDELAAEYTKPEELFWKLPLDALEKR